MNILAIGAHPDDLEYGCGGTLLKFSHSGYKISLLVLTKGEVGGAPKVREKEQINSAKILNARLYWGGEGFYDTKVTLSKELIDRIESVIKLIKPNLIFVHYPEDTHQDHRNVSQATITATRYIRNVLFYEVPTTVNFSPTVFVDIGKMLKSKLKLLKAHKSQIYLTRVKGLSILESANSTAIFRGFQNRVKFAEGFIPLRLALDFYL
ncbi:MAG: PIG-L family deacetylase [Elusimicrobiota bacterium]|nr:PIG-L family deacetylase [Elusimicrobiota bacterium]